jgi:hypothetical protein
MANSQRSSKEEQTPHVPVREGLGDRRLSRRSLLNAGGTSMAVVVMSRLGDRSVARSIALQMSGANPAGPGSDLVITIPNPAEGLLTLTQVDASQVKVVAQGLSTAVLSPDGQAAAYGASPSPMTAPSAVSVVQPQGDSSQTWNHKSPAFNTTHSFCRTCVLPGQSGVVVTCYDGVNVQGQTPISRGLPGVRTYSLATRTVVVANSSGTVSLSLPVGPTDIMGTDVVPIDETNVAVFTLTGVVANTLAKQPRALGPPSGASYFVINTATSQVSGRFPSYAGPGAAEHLSVGNGMVARLVGGPNIELVSASGPPVHFPAPLVSRSRRYVPAGYADPQAGTLTLFDFADGTMQRLELASGQVQASSSIPLSVSGTSRARRPAADVDIARDQLLVADPSNPRSGVWVVDMQSLAVVDRWVSMMPVGDIRVLYGIDRVLVRAPQSTTALLLDHDGQISGALELEGQLVR